jgi:mitochondrial fission protein ELM1
MKSHTDASVENIAPTVTEESASKGLAFGLAGRRGWIVSDGVAGHLTITRGVAEILGLAYEVKPVAPRAPWRHLAPFGPADPHIIGTLLAEPLPDIVLGAGRQTVPIVRALRRKGMFTALFQSPRAGLGSADIIWAPAHDRLNGPNVITTLTPPHRFTTAKLAALRSACPAEIAALPSPRIAILVGGPGAGYDYDARAVADFAARLSAIAPQAGSFLITPSRRTPPPLLAAVDAATHGKPRILWNGNSDNPYPDFLANADMFIVTADSVNMAGEACGTGQPVYVFAPPGGREKFRHFHQRLQDHGATRPLPESPAALAGWSYEPLQAAADVAAEIDRRWCDFRSTTRRS